MKNIIDRFKINRYVSNDISYNGLDLANIPLIDRSEFNELYERNTFGKYNDIASNLNAKGYSLLNIEDTNWNNLLDRVNADFTNLFKTKSINLNIDRFQDSWLHYDLKSVRDIACHQEILKALKVIYGREAFPFQTLNFLKGSSQDIHSDSVHFHSLPYGYMCGIWVALEDVVKESGPLFYYPSSHRLKYITPADLKITIEEINAQPHPQKFFEDYWRNSVKEFGLKQKQFLAKRGDVFIWHSNLLHGGSVITNKLLSRKSQVTHYFFRQCAYKRPFLDAINSTESNYNFWFTPKDLTSIS